MTTLTPTLSTAPYRVGEKVRGLSMQRGGTTLSNGVVTNVVARYDGRFDVHTDITDHAYIVPASGRSDFLSAGHLGECGACFAPVDVQNGTGTWMGPRDLLVCRGGCK